MLLVQLTWEGVVGDFLLIGHAGSPVGGSYPNAESLFVGLPRGGETSYDEILDIEWTDEGL